jgi:hypothetical protein
LLACTTKSPHILRFLYRSGGRQLDPLAFFDTMVFKSVFTLADIERNLLKMRE